MKRDIILCGVGGQGILSIAATIALAATGEGLYLKQAEVHGMSQRGGDVQSNLRLSTLPVMSDLIPMGQCDLIVSMEPMEALRYLPYMSREGVIVTSDKPLVNIPDYPDPRLVARELRAWPRLVMGDTEGAARRAGSPRSVNMALLGMAARHLRVVSPGAARHAVSEMFKRRGPEVEASNLAAFDLGMELDEAAQDTPAT